MGRVFFSTQQLSVNRKSRGIFLNSDENILLLVNFLVVTTLGGFVMSG